MLSLATGQKLHMTFEQGGSLIVETEFLRRLGGARLGTEKSRVFAIRRPQGVENVQRRSHVRVDLERIVRIKSLGALGGEKIGAGRTINIGAGGVQFTSEMALMFGDQLRVALVLTPRNIVVAGGPIVRIDEMAVAGAAEGTPGGRTRVAVRFDKITEADQERISVHILAAARNRESVTAGPVLIAAPDAAPEPAAETGGEPLDLEEPAPSAAGHSTLAHS
jgi:c-di-GMP-binding flagellar brake protein YcgR